MGIKADIKGVKELRQNLKRLVPDVRKEYAKNASRKIKRLVINDHISKGITPVSGAPRYKDYSFKYAQKKKGGKRRPVTLKDKGDLHASFVVKVIRGIVSVNFTDFKADIHNRRGAGKSKVVRRMLPTKRGEKFKRKIMRGITEALDVAVKRIIRRIS